MQKGMIMWAFAVISLGNRGCIVPCGNDGAMKLRNKTLKGWLRETECFRKNTIGNVYVVKDWTQEMCEMSPTRFAEYVSTHYVAILK